jgi:hypothetical protein
MSVGGGERERKYGDAISIGCLAEHDHPAACHFVGADPLATIDTISRQKRPRKPAVFWAAFGLNLTYANGNEAKQAALQILFSGEQVAGWGSERRSVWERATMLRSKDKNGAIPRGS